MFRFPSKLVEVSLTKTSSILQHVKTVGHVQFLSLRCYPANSYHTNLSSMHKLNLLMKIEPSYCLCTSQNVHSSPIVFKTQKKNQRKKGSKNYADDENEDDMIGIEDDEEGLDTNSAKVMCIRVSSLRTDTILRSAFQIARNKIEKMFYESKIRVNGYKIMKKSHNVALGDEVDLVKGFSPVNPKFLLVQRVKILAASDPDSQDEEENITLKIRRYKRLTIDNYEGDVYKESAPSDS